MRVPAAGNEQMNKAGQENVEEGDEASAGTLSKDPVAPILSA